MLARAQAVQDPVAKIRALLLAARPRIQADSRELDLAWQEEPPPGQPAGTGPSPDPGAAITKMRAHLRALRTAVLAVSGGGPAGTSARDLTAQTLLETDQSLEKLAQSLAAPDPDSAGELWGESVRLGKQAMSTSVNAEKALGIPWPL